MSTQKQSISDAERWKADLIAAGWSEASATSWYSPDGGLYRGPFGAWKELQRRNEKARPGLELLVNCADCGSILNAELCCQTDHPFSKQIFLTVDRCKCKDG
jgi:hypothetical protein